MLRFSIAVMLLAAFAVESQARTVCIGGKCYQVADAPAPSKPTPAAIPASFASHNSSPAPVASDCPTCSEHSIVTHHEGRRPLRRLLRGTCRVAMAPFRLAGKAVRGVRSRRGCCH
jgi:hypothetical protein